MEFKLTRNFFWNRWIFISVFYHLVLFFCSYCVLSVFITFQTTKKSVFFFFFTLVKCEILTFPDWIWFVHLLVPNCLYSCRDTLSHRVLFIVFVVVTLIRYKIRLDCIIFFCFFFMLTHTFFRVWLIHYLVVVVVLPCRFHIVSAVFFTYQTKKVSKMRWMISICCVCLCVCICT